MLRAREHLAGTQSDAENVSGEQTGSPNLLQALRGQAGLTDGTKLIQSIKINKYIRPLIRYFPFFSWIYFLWLVLVLAIYVYCILYKDACLDSY